MVPWGVVRKGALEVGERVARVKRSKSAISTGMELYSAAIRADKIDDAWEVE